MSGRRRTRTRSWPRLRRGRGRQPRTLRTRLVVSAVALIAVVASVIGTVTTFALSEHLYDQLAANVQDIAKRTDGPRGPGPGASLRGGALGDSDTLTLTTDEKLQFVTKGGSPQYTIGAVVEDGTVVKGVVGKLASSSTTGQQEMTAVTLSKADLAALAGVPTDRRAHRVSLPDRGDYLVRYETNRDGDAFYVGLPTESVTNTLNTLIAVELSVTGAGLVAAGIAGSVLVGVALRPLRKVAATATRVSELPLHTGEVTLNERVPASETDPHTEVGQVGAALNRMLDHIHGALHSRQESETRVRQFVADASHELRTPLASIRGYAELTRRGREEIGPDTRHALGRIESESGRMTMLVEDLLLLARLDAGRPLQFEQTDLIPLVVDTVSDARVAGRSHSWRLDLPDVPALVSADAARLQQVLVNLLANARTHTPPGTTVTARVQRRGPWMCVDVEDDGQGIPEELLPHVFERFARGDSSRSRASGSTGLGLAIVQAVADAHGGAVTVDSVPGRTVFTVHLPALGRDVPLLDDAANWQLDEARYDGESDGDDLLTGAARREPDSQAHHSVSTRA
ncbi:HAMP domain-containing sensor histidine kinase [Streptomyces scabiei]|uniref:sensor histidine kinase n=1 Tax=Streptomyces scabiei TaxID=1930 RepID=UPI001B312727|nr:MULTISPECIES: HAMP domain-containing sensor histidine kinase [Streptomyces]MBP5862694.1 HAMP domain-containing histidine kinase [Streptomyces sp. LBUM 1484]MBP5876858.1 HAMP domain-containing histidine kinase [Streptomyces sp. LBUM 1477]MBP5884642.1 HAMP domain-containing histidine kinase [Streptomyces sp. LBUM 1487]MBP5900601.1 HAMP domain-containing histidine kinase [Streptomyces sp. LBUM 1488]MDW8474110.1 HAMP domain-containing sensor histidine kinase [Streptomyces scabiei]